MRIAIIPVLAVALIVSGCAAGATSTPSASPTPRAVASTPSVASAAPATPSTSPAPPTATPTTVATTTATTPTTAPPTELPITALDAKFDGPRGLALDAGGTMYVTQCQWTYAAIDRIDPAGMVTRFAGTGKPGFSGDGGPATEAQLFCPTGIAIGPDGAVYFADHVNNRIRRVDAQGLITTFAGSGPAGLNLGTFSGDGGPATQATLQEPWGVAFDASGRLYIADRDNARVRRVDTNGDITTVAGTGSTEGSTADGGKATEAEICPPVGLAVDEVGDLIIPDACESTIRMVDAKKGNISTITGTDSPDLVRDTGSEGNAVLGPNGWFFQAGTKILQMNGVGYLSPFAGNGTIGVPIEGSAAIDSPLPVEIWGLAADPIGNVYVADGATSVWRIDTGGVITRFAGKQE